MRHILGMMVLAFLFVGPATAELRHRYSFNDGTARDSVGRADGVTVNDPRITDGELVFDPAINDGQNRDVGTGQYVVLPAGLLNHRSWTIELWTTYRGGKPWQRVVDFGNSVPATDVEMARNHYAGPQAVRGRGFLAIMHNMRGHLVGQCSIASWGEDADTDLCGAREGLAPHRQHHVVFTHDLGLREQKLYVNGLLVGAGLARVDARDTQWTNGYIGRSQFTWDPLYNGRINELRIYDHALTRDEVTAHTEAGPDERLPRRPKNLPGR